jgi:hypothetical protein
MPSVLYNILNLRPYPSDLILTKNCQTLCDASLPQLLAYSIDCSNGTESYVDEADFKSNRSAQIDLETMSKQ